LHKERSVVAEEVPAEEGSKTVYQLKAKEILFASIIFAFTTPEIMADPMFPAPIKHNLFISPSKIFLSYILSDFNFIYLVLLTIV